MDKLYAHSSDRGEYELLSVHLFEVAELAAEFARPFGYSDVAMRCGYLHDYGKAQYAFQKRVRGSSVRCDHSTPGALEAYNDSDYITAICVAGHHAGLPDWVQTVETGEGVSFQDRIGSAKSIDAKHVLSSLNLPPSREWSTSEPGRPYDFPFLTRMIFSCLVDADFLCTEAFMRGSPPPRGIYSSLDMLNLKLLSHTKAWEPAKNELNQKRNEIRLACLEQANNPPGLYSLTVPTGGGKTISSMSFALSHAIKNNQKRIIYVIPYTSIIDQIVKEFSDIFGAENVLAHHSNVDFNILNVVPNNESDNDAEMNIGMRHQLATENWDAPIIITTAVQFFESFHAARSSRCRKLHNVASAVVIFDEAQLFPRSFLHPCVELIGSLVRNYNVTALLCTATQPSLEEFFTRIDPTLRINEIITNPQELYNQLKRVCYQFDEPINTENLASVLMSYSQVLCIVNTKSAARDVFLGMSAGEDDCFHLSTWMMPYHRQNTLSIIRTRLKQGLPCRVISTSLIEAGVDVDFPVVYREINRLDSILQAGGRCNRENLRSLEESIVHIFQFSDRKLPASVIFDVDRTRKVTLNSKVDDFRTIGSFFKQIYYELGSTPLDEHKIIEKMSNFMFRQVQKDFKIIKDSGWSIYIPTESTKEDFDRLRNGEINRDLMRRLSNYCVQVYENNFKQLLAEHAIEMLETIDKAAILLRSEAYQENLGLRFVDIQLTNEVY